MAERALFQYAVISDTHIRLPDAVEEGGYASNREGVERAEYLVRCLNSLRLDFVVHLGDLVHPIPALDNHEAAVEKAQQIFSAVQAKFYALPGNHDIGDKPNAWLPAPVVEEHSHHVFTKYWGPLYQSFTIDPCHFICLDTPVLNSGFEREHEQRAWLEGELNDARAKGLRIFVFMHYPLFICDPLEPIHYDNVDDPARTWLRELFDDYAVEAVFSGHVHNAFVGVHQGTIYYSLPSVAFVRPEYSELATITPGDEFGRNDTAKLGFYIVKVYQDRHEIVPIRTYGAGQMSAGMPSVEPYQIPGAALRQFGVTLRRGWGRRVELAADGLDEFSRKEAYRDGLLIALMELGVKALRVPMADLAHADVRQRLMDFVKFGFEFTVFSLSIPDQITLAVMAAYGGLIENWELIFPEHAEAQIGIAVGQARQVFAGQIFIAPVVPIKESDDGKTFQHFASHGFSCRQISRAQNWLSQIEPSSGEIGLTFRVSPWDEPGVELREIERASDAIKVVNLQLPRRDEGVCFDDDSRLGAFIVEAYRASQLMTHTTVFVDTFVDSDRGYYPRIGLVDRRYNPRPAFYALKLAAQE